MSNKPTAHKVGFFQQTKKFLLSSFVILTFIAYVFHERHLNAVASTAGSTTSPNIASIPTQPIPTNAGIYRNGTFTGPQVDAYYGLVQVQVIIQGGSISEVQFLQYPNDRRTSREINAQAMPWLVQEAIQAQSASVDLITGATLTSQAFALSLKSALQSARN
jgi:uncharacterized protein with FMN-binding domain